MTLLGTGALSLDTPYNRFAHALARSNGADIRNGQARCPAHDDRTPSLSVTVGQDGRVLLNCHAGCHTEDVVAAVGLTMADLFDEARRPDGDRPQVVARYPYVDESGTVLFHVERLEPGYDGKRKSFVQRPANGRKGPGAMKDVRRVIYRLPQVLDAVTAGQTVYVAEGEKDVHALERAGQVATTNPGGAGKWRHGYNAPLAGADVVIVADRDKPGLDHAQQIAAELAGVADSVRIVQPARGKDAADHLAAGLDVDALELLSLDAPDPAEDDSDTGNVDMHVDPDLDEFLDSDEPEYDWLIEGLVERGDRIIITGPEGGGKSTLLRQIGVQAASGTHPFTHEPIPPLQVLYVDTENSTRQARRALRKLRDVAGDTYQPGRLRIRVLGHAIDLADDAIYLDLASRINAQGVDLLIIGPLYKLLTDDPIKELPAKAVADNLDRLRAIRGSAVLIEAHSPYAEGARAKRPTRPYGASLWSRWPEFGIYLDPDGGALHHWRGQRDERAWPDRLAHATPWPWAPVAGSEADEEWHGPTKCADAIAAVFAEIGEELSTNKLADELRARGLSYRNQTIAEAAALACQRGDVTRRKGPRSSWLYGPKDATGGVGEQHEATF